MLYATVIILGNIIHPVIKFYFAVDMKVSLIWINLALSVITNYLDNIIVQMAHHVTVQLGYTYVT